MLIPLPYKILALVFVVGGVFAAGYRKGIAQGEVEIQRAANDAEDLRHQLQLEQQRIREVVKVEYVDRITRIKEKETKIRSIEQKIILEKLRKKIKSAYLLAEYDTNESITYHTYYGKHTVD